MPNNYYNQDPNASPDLEAMLNAPQASYADSPTIAPIAGAQGPASPAAPQSPDVGDFLKSILSKNASRQPTPEEALNSALSSPEMLMAQQPQAPEVAPRAASPKPAPSTPPLTAQPEAAPNASSASQANDPSSAMAMMKNLYGDKYGDEAMQSAVDNRNHTQQAVNFQKAANEIAAAISKTGMKPMNDTLDARAKQSEQGISDIAAGRKAKDEQVAGTLKLQDLTDKKALQDPGSNASIAYRNLAKAMLPDKVKSIPGFDNMSAEGIKQNLPMIDIAIKRDYMNADMAVKQRAHHEESQNKADTELQNRRTQLLGGRGAGAKPFEGVRRADSFLETVAQYKNANDIPPDVVYKLIEDVDAMYKGGAATVAGTSAGVPHTISSRIATLRQNLTNNPTGAGVGKIIGQYANLAQGLKDMNQRYIDKLEKPLIESYKSRLSPERYEQHMQKFLAPKSEETKNQSAGVAPPPQGKIHVQAADGSHWYIDADKADKLPPGAKVIQ